MIHVMSAFSIVDFSLSLCTIFLAWVAYKRFFNRIYFSVMFIISGIALHVMVEAVHTYLTATNMKGNGIMWPLFFYLAISYCNFIIQRSLYRLLSVRFTLVKLFVHGLVSPLPFTLAVTCVIAGRETRPIFGTIIEYVTNAQPAVCMFIMIRYHRRLQMKEIKTLVNSMLVMVGVSIPLFFMESLLKTELPWSGWFGVGSPSIFVFFFIWNLLVIRFLVSQLVKKPESSGPVIDWPMLQDHDLTNREKEVAELLVHRRSKREIGKKLFISLATVKSHVHHIFQKLDVLTRKEFRELMEGLKK